MKTPIEVREAKTRMINQGNLIAELIDHDGFVLLKKRMDARVEEAKAFALTATSYEELCERRGILEGLKAFDKEITTILSRGKKQKHLTSK